MELKWKSWESFNKYIQMMKLTLIALILFFNFIQADHIMES